MRTDIVRGIIASHLDDLLRFARLAIERASREPRLTKASHASAAEKLSDVGESNGPADVDARPPGTSSMPPVAVPPSGS